MHLCRSGSSRWFWRGSSMLNDINPGRFRIIYIACGYTDLRYGVDGLARVIQEEFELDSFQTDILFLFCGRRSDRIGIRAAKRSTSGNAESTPRKVRGAAWAAIFTKRMFTRRWLRPSSRRSSPGQNALYHEGGDGNRSGDGIISLSQH